MIFYRYKNKRKLGRGPYGDVVLADDPQGKEVAIKLISKQLIEMDPYMQEYLEAEK